MTGVKLLHTTGGIGALLTGIAVTSIVLFLTVRYRHASRRRQLWTAARTFVLVLLVWDGVSFASYVGYDNGDSVSQRMVTWGRDHDLGVIIDRLETIVYSSPPAAKPAENLSVASPMVEPTTTTVPARPTGGTTPPTTTTILTPKPPAALTPLINPALGSEGQWAPAARAGGVDAIWVTGIRPLPQFGSVLASVAVIDQTYLRVGMFNGNEDPGGTWKRGSKLPEELWPSLLATMNGGFRLEHSDGGYLTEGKVMRALKPGRATMAIDREGRLSIGELGRDMFDDGSWMTLRQNLNLLVDGGQSQIERGKREHIWWGANSGDGVYVNRSALCELPDGRLAYAMVQTVDAEQLAQALINIGCVKAMQLDVNENWVSFFTYEHVADGSLSAHRLDRQMWDNSSKYFKGASREFFAFFDTTLVPSPSVLDS